MYTYSKIDLKKILSNKENVVEVLTCLKTNISYKNLNKLKSDELYDILLNNFDKKVFHEFVRLKAFKIKYSKENIAFHVKIYEESSKIIESEFNSNKRWAFNPSCYEDQLIKCVRKNKSVEEGRIEQRIICDINYVIKSFNNSRSFLFEYFLIRNNLKILPTLSNSRGIDIFLEKKWDLKNTSGVTSQFKKDFGENWKSVAQKNPKLVAEYLYKNQGEERFDSDDRIFIIDLSDKIKSVGEIENICKKINFDEIYIVNFEKEINGVKNFYTTNAMVVFL